MNAPAHFAPKFGNLPSERMMIPDEAIDLAVKAIDLVIKRA